MHGFSYSTYAVSFICDRDSKNALMLLVKNTNSTNKLHFIICVYYYFKNSWSLVQQY